MWTHQMRDMLAKAVGAEDVFGPEASRSDDDWERWDRFAAIVTMLGAVLIVATLVGVTVVEVIR